MKKSAKILALLLTVAMLLSVLMACNKGDSGKTGEQTAPASTAEESAGEASEQSEESTADSMSADYLDITGVDFSNPSISIAYDDFDGMKDLATKMQNFEIEANTVVEIDGEVGMDMMNHSIVIPSEDGSTRIGTTYEVVGLDDDAIPTEEGTRIHIVGVVRANSNYFNVLVVPADQFEVLGE